MELIANAQQGNMFEQTTDLRSGAESFSNCTAVKRVLMTDSDHATKFKLCHHVGVSVEWDSVAEVFNFHS